MITKTLQRSEDLYIQFTDEELNTLGLKQGDKLSWEHSEEGIVLKKFVKIDIDIKDFSREVLEMLVIQSVENDVSVNEVISNILEAQLKKQNV